MVKEPRLLHIKYTPEQLKKLQLAGYTGAPTTPSAPTATSYTPEQARALQSGAGSTSQSYQDILNAGKTTTPTTPLIPTSVVKSPTGGYTSVADVKKANEDYYIKNGAKSPELDAYAYNLQNPQAPKTVEPQPNYSSAQTPQRNSRIPTPTPTAPGVPTPKILTGADLQAEADKRRDKHLSDLGISSDQFNQVNTLLQQGYRYAGTENNQPYFVNAQGEKVLLKINESGAQAAVGIAGTDYKSQIQTEQEAAAKATSDAATNAANIEKNAPTPTTPVPSPTGTTSTGEPTVTIDGVSPEVQAAYSDLLTAVSSGNSAGITAAIQRWTALNNDTSVADAAATSKEDLKTSQEAILGAAKDVYQNQLDRAAELKREEEFNNASAAKQFALDQAKAENDQRLANAQQEQRNRNIAASLGINHDTNGLKWMNEEIQKGSEMLTYLEQSGAVKSASFAENTRRIIENYRLNTNDADNTYNSNLAKISSDYQTALRQIDQTVTLDQKDREKQKFDLMQTVFTQLSEADTKKAELLKDMRIKTIDDFNASLDDARTDAQNAMSNLLTLRGQGVQNLSPEMLKGLQEKLPGIDVAAILKDPTTAALKAAQDSMTDLNTSSASFSDPVQASIMDGANLAANGMSVAAGEGFRNEVARKLRAGDTEGAKQYMYTQIANNLKGTALTEYDARSNQILQIGSILDAMDAKPDFNYSTAEYYKQKALSAIGQASPEYYSLMAPIAQLSAEITHGLSGAAVSPSEWSRLQKFMPRTGEGKAVLEAKLLGLQKIATWENQAKIARAANLPIPPDPSLTEEDQKAAKNTTKEHFDPSAGANEVIHDTLAPANGVPLSYINNFTLTQNYGSMWDKEHGYMNGPHLALDLAPKHKGEITHVPALRGGKVVAMNNIKGLGNSITIQDDDGNLYQYGHLASQDVKVGDTVEADQSLGVMGSTGQSTGVHLHLAVKDKNGNFVDPRDYLS